ncbi:MAG: hypothetical protein KAS32_00190 [Candidatus Peribacteraceae bacterium]|nr:hypothetical protein [Candidatus Peribacteraceae bacterium]
MRTISTRVKKRISDDPFYDQCCRLDEKDCDGCITWEHALIYAGRQMDEVFAILPVCEFHHAVNMHQGGGKLDKKKHEWIAISRMTDEDKNKYPNRDWNKDLNILIFTYGTYD